MEKSEGFKRMPRRDLKNIRDSGFGKKTRNVIIGHVTAALVTRGNL